MSAFVVLFLFFFVALFLGPSLYELLMKPDDGSGRGPQIRAALARLGYMQLPDGSHRQQAPQRAVTHVEFDLGNPENMVSLMLFGHPHPEASFPSWFSMTLQARGKHLTRKDRAGQAPGKDAAVTQLSIGEALLEADGDVFTRSCLSQYAIEAYRPLEFAQIRAVEVQQGAFRIEAQIPSQPTTSKAALADAEQIIQSALAELLAFAEILRWPGHDPAALLDLLIEDEDAPMALRERAFGLLVRQHPGAPQTRRLLERVFTPRAATLRRLLFAEGNSDLLEGLDLDRLVKLLNAEVSPTGGRSEVVMKRLAARMTRRALLHPALSPAARQELLGRMMGQRGDDELEQIIHQLLARLDGNELCELLGLLEHRGGPAAARALYTLVESPEKIDTPSERRAMLGALRALSPHLAEFDTPALERFLCQNVLTPEHDVALAALGALERLGGAEALAFLANQARGGAEALANPTLMRRIEAVIKTLHQRTGQDMYGGLSLAEQQGGELTLTADAGGLELADE